MAIRTILVPVSGGVGGDSALDAALAIAGRSNAHIEALHVVPSQGDMVPILGEGASAALIEDLVTAAQRDAALRTQRAEAAFAAALAGGIVTRMDGPPASIEARLRHPTINWRLAEGREDEVVARRGRLFDLIVVPRPGGEGDVAPETTLEAALVESGRPVLVSPPVLGPTMATRVAIAWNGSMAAARAVAAARPFLAKAQSVVILEGDGAAADGATAEDLAAILAWRGIAAGIHRFRSDGGGIGLSILDAANQAGADLVVMGGYGHSRLREMIFGGATIDAMFESNLPLLMTH